ncbi:MAG: type II secretion system F family protein [Planctomycetes bacterium]|nr:type II secretion system F family protein [Planctomycetota bacterium]
MTPADRPAAARPAAKKPAAKKPAAAGGKPRAATPAARPAGGKRGFFRRVPGKELSQFTSRLSTLVNAGLPLVRCLRILESQQKAGPLRLCIEAVADDVEGGAPLSEALAKYPQVFDRLYVNMVRAGEVGGLLGTILDRLAGFNKKRENIKGQVKGALTYPLLVMCFAGIILLVTMLVIVPKFEGMFESFNTEMPLLTRLLLGLSGILVDYWWALFAIPVLLVVTFKLLLRGEGFARRVDGFKLKIPFVGDVITKTIVARFARTMGTLLSSGVPILEALSIVRASISNRVVAEAIGDVHDAIREGETMAAPLAESGVFDDMVVNMIDVGEETGQLDQMLVTIAEDYETELDTSITVLFKALEPLMLLFVALVVGTIAFALFSPMVKLMETFSNPV